MQRIATRSIFAIFNMAALAFCPSLLLIIFTCLAALHITNITKSFVAALFLAIMCLAPIIGPISIIIDAIAPSVDQFPFIFLIFSITNICLGFFLKKPIEISLIDKGDISSLAASTLITLILCIPFSLAAPAEKAVIFTTGGDAANHYMLFNYNLANGSPSYFNNEARMLDILLRYPQGLHTSMALAFSGWSRTTHLVQQLNFYYLVNVCYCGSMVFFFTQLVNTVTSKRLALSATFGLIFWALVGVYLLYWGFFTQIAGFAYTFAFFHVLLREDKHGNALGHTVLIIFLLIGISISWYLLLLFPAMAMVSHRKYYLSNLKKNKWIFALSTPLILASPVLNISSSNKDLIRLLPEKYAAQSNTLLLPGSVHAYGISAITFMLLACTALAIASKNLAAHNKKLPSSLLFGCIATYAVAALIAAYQLVSVGEIRYYTYKILFLTMSFALIISAWTIDAILRHANKCQKNLSLAFLTASYFILLQSTLYSTTLNSQLKINVGTYFAENILSQSGNENTVFISSCNPVSAQISNNWINAIYLNNTVEKRDLAKYAAAHSDKQSSTIDKVYDDCKTDSLQK